MSGKVKVYGASKLAHSGMWIELRKAWPEITFTAHWPDLHIDGIPDEHAGCARLFWEQDYDDVLACDVVLIYSQPEDKLRGALVEAGMGIAFHRRVIVVGEHSDYGTWQYHPSVLRASCLDDARLLLRCIAMRFK